MSRRRELLVDAAGTGEFCTVAAALRRAASGDRIVIRTGRYRESLTIDRSVELVGSPPRAAVIVGAGGVTCDIRADGVRLRDLTVVAPGAVFAGRPRSRDVAPGGHDDPTKALADQAWAIRAAGFAVELEGCLIDGRDGGGIVVEGADGRLTVAQTAIVDAPVAGLWLAHGARASITDCELRDNAIGLIVAGGHGSLRDVRFFSQRQVSLWVARGGQVLAERLRFGRDAGDAVRVGERGWVELREALIRDSAGAAVVLDFGAGAVLAAVRVARAATDGLRVAANARLHWDGGRVSGVGGWGLVAAGPADLRLTEVRFEGNRTGALDLVAPPSGQFERCEFREHPQRVVRVGAGAAGRFVDCRWYANRTAHGIELAARARVDLIRSSLGRQGGAAIVMEPDSVLSATDCEVSKNGEGVAVGRGGRLTMVRCRLRRQRGDAVRVGVTADVILRECELAANEGVGVRVDGSGSLTLDGGTLRQNGGPAAVVVRPGALLRATKTRIEANRGAGVLLEGSAAAELRDLVVVGNRGYGLEVDDETGLAVESCDLRGNARGPWWFATTAVRWKRRLFPGSNRV